MSARTAAIVAALLSAAPALAYQQTMENGHGLKWPGSSVTFTVNTARPNSSPSCQVAATDPALDAVQAAFGAWTNATHPGDPAPCTKLSLVYGGTTSSITVGADASTHLVVFRQGWCSNNAQAQADACSQANPPNCDNKFNCFEDVGSMSRNVLALTTVLYQPSTGVIGDADMEVVDWDGTAGSIQQPPADGWYWTCFNPTSQGACSTYGQDGCYYMDLQNTVTHEAGHFIGLAHPCETDPGTATANGVPVCSQHPEMASVTMYPSAPLGETTKRTLAADDVNGVCAIYGTLSSGSAVKSSSGGCGAGGATPVGLIVLATALAALAPRRRRARR